MSIKSLQGRSTLLYMVSNWQVMQSNESRISQHEIITNTSHLIDEDKAKLAKRCPHASCNKA